MKRLKTTLLLLLCVFGIANAQNDAVYIYRNDGEFNAFLKSDIDSMRYSHFDADSVYQPEWQMQEVFTPDSTYRIPITAIDSISFVTPPVQYQEGTRIMENDLLKYLVAYSDSTLTFSPDVPLYLIPSVGEVLVYDKYEDPIPEGFFGRYVSRVQTASGWLCNFEGVGLNDIFSHLVLVGKVSSYTDDTEPDAPRRAPTIGIGKQIPLPSRLPLFASINDVVVANDILGSETLDTKGVDGKVGITLQNPKLTLDYVVCIREDNLKDFVKFVVKFKSDGVAEISGNCSGQYKPEPHWFANTQWPINFYGISGQFDLGLSFEAAGEINAKYTVPVSVDLVRGFSYTEGLGFDPLTREQRSDFKLYQDKADWELNINGTLFAGLAGRLSVGIVHSKVASLDLTLSVGPEVSGNYRIADLETGFNTNLYDVLRDAKVSQTLRVQLDAGYRIWFKERESFGHPLTGNFFQTTRPLLPTITNPQWSPTGMTSGTLSANVINDVFIPVKLGWTVLDSNDKVYKQKYFSDSYQLNEAWGNPSLLFDLHDLPANCNYKAYPTVKFLMFEIPVNDYAEIKPRECPVRITNFEQTASQYSKGAFHYNGRNYDYRYDVAVTVMVESLDAVAEWGYAYKDPSGDVTRIPLTQFGTSYTDTRYVYYRNEAKSSACLYGYVKYKGSDDYLYGAPVNYPLEHKQQPLCSCPDDHHPHAIDLGLPSGILWSCMNVGANSPEGYGDYFAWGETKPKSYYDDSTYKWGFWDNMTKYCTESERGIVDNQITLKPEDDAVHVNWGGAWSMPTFAELTELRTACRWTWTIQNGVEGYKVTGLNGNSIFLPAAGFRVDGGLYYAGSRGYYWSSSLYTSNSLCAYFLGFFSGDYVWSYDSRYCGHSVRPVCQ